MALIPWGFSYDVVDEISRLEREMTNLLSAFRTGTPATWRPLAGAAVYPPLNLYEDDEGYMVRAEVPGVEKGALDIDMTGDTLTIRGVRKADELPPEGSYHRHERDFGEFRRSLTLPKMVDSGKVVATFTDGILQIRLPFAEEAKSRKITVRSNS